MQAGYGEKTDKCFRNIMECDSPAMIGFLKPCESLEPEIL